VLGYRKLSLSIIDNFAVFLVIELSIISAKIIDNSLNSIFDKNTGISTQRNFVNSINKIQGMNLKKAFLGVT
jgi:hypothetical protein